MKPELNELIETTAKECGVDGALALAIAQVESGMNPAACRYEPKWKYLAMPEIFAAANLITVDTEIILQKLSWGCLQVMGSVVRELGYHGPLNALSEASLGILYGCKKLAELQKQYRDEDDLIAAYNAGHPDKSTGKYRNQSYVDAVKKALQIYRRLGSK